MFVSHVDKIEKKRLEGPTLKNVEKQVLIGPEQGWEGWVMRKFTLGKEGYTPRHSHSWPHIVLVVEGEGSLYMDGKDYPLTAGSTSYVTGGLEHSLKNTGSETFAFICIVPEEGDV
ncbi:MAG: cupin domain-containing protein [Spirochaetales bacterium]|nr:cupin domain-containing protein [Spirochaetales bacterium]